MPGKPLESGPKTGLDHSLRLHRFCADRIRCLLKGGQEGIDILVGGGELKVSGTFSDDIGGHHHTCLFAAIMSARDYC